MPDNDLVWTREARTGVEVAHTPVGTYRLLFSGYDLIVTRDSKPIGRGYRQTALAIANNDHSIRTTAASTGPVVSTPNPAGPPAVTRAALIAELRARTADATSGGRPADVEFGMRVAINDIAYRFGLTPDEYDPTQKGDAGA